MIKMSGKVSWVPRRGPAVALKLSTCWAGLPKGLEPRCHRPSSNAERGGFAALRQASDLAAVFVAPVGIVGYIVWVGIVGWQFGLGW